MKELEASKAINQNSNAKFIRDSCNVLERTVAQARSAAEASRSLAQIAAALTRAEGLTEVTPSVKFGMLATYMRAAISCAEHVQAEAGPARDDAIYIDDESARELYEKGDLYDMTKIALTYIDPEDSLATSSAIDIFKHVESVLSATAEACDMPSHAKH